MRLLLISNSTQYGSGYLDHCADAISVFLGTPAPSLAFVPYALFDRDAYAARARERFRAIGVALESIHHAPDGARIKNVGIRWSVR